MYTLNPINIQDVNDFNVQPVAAAVMDELYASDSKHDLLSQPASIGEVERAYFGDELTSIDSDMFEAVTTERRRLGRTMRAFNRVLNQMLSGTGIVAGRGADSEDEDSEGTSSVVGGVEVGKVRRVAGVPILSVRIPLSDGQSVFMMFHSPTSSGANIRATDTLTAYRFLLNRKDVTHVVAPIRGRDVSLRQTCMALSNLIEKNSKLFQKKRAFNDQLKADIEAELTKSEQKENELQTLVDQADGLRASVSKLSTESATINERIGDQEAENARLEREYAELVKERDDANKNREAAQAKKEAKAKLPPVIEDMAGLKAKFDKKKKKKVKLKDGTIIEQTNELDVKVTLPSGEVYLAKFNDTLPISEWLPEGERVFTEAYDFYVSRLVQAPAEGKKPTGSEHIENDLAQTIQAISTETGKSVEAVTGWVEQHQMTNIDATKFKSDPELTSDQKGYFIESGVQYPANDIAVAELVAKYAHYIATAATNVDTFIVSDVKKAADILLSRSIKKYNDSGRKINPSTALNASLLVLSLIGSDTDKEQATKVSNSGKVKAVEALRVFMKANKLLEANQEQPLNLNSQPDVSEPTEKPLEPKITPIDEVEPAMKPTITAALSLLEGLKSYQAPDFQTIKEKQSQVALAVNELHQEGLLDEYSGLANEVVDNISANMKRLGGM